jgi:hypothetical protein
MLPARATFRATRGARGGGQLGSMARVGNSAMCRSAPLVARFLTTAPFSNSQPECCLSFGSMGGGTAVPELGPCVRIPPPYPRPSSSNRAGGLRLVLIRMLPPHPRRNGDLRLLFEGNRLIDGRSALPRKEGRYRTCRQPADVCELSLRRAFRVLKKPTERQGPLGQDDCGRYSHRPITTTVKTICARGELNPTFY